LAVTQIKETKDYDKVREAISTLLASEKAEGFDDGNEFEWS